MPCGALPVRAITPQAFTRFGTVVDWTPDLEKTGNSFHIVVRSEAPTGWRLAVLKVVARAVQRMENHPATEELFAAIDGRAILLVAPRGELSEEAIQAFFLDRPVSVGPGVWHGVIALSESATILIAENLEVTGERYNLSRPIEAMLF